MKELTLERYYTPNQLMGTFGVLKGLPAVFYTVENPWLNNRVRESCIPEGIYTCTPRRYNKGGYDAYLINDVPGRDLCLTHIANIHKHVDGCIGIGDGLGFVSGCWAVTNSKRAFDAFMAALNKEPFRLTITHFRPLQEYS